ncbi:MAG TPA: MFS transporter [Rhizomicrobium sp.]
MSVSARDRNLSLLAILSSCTAFAVGIGLTLPLLSLILERQGYPGSVNGLNLATAGLAAILITPNVPRLIRRFGTASFLVGSLALSAAALLALYAAPSLWMWFPARFVLSLGLNGLFVASEFWINQLADESNRGRYVALYGIAISGGFALGPAILYFAGTRGIAPFALGSAMLLLAILPVLLARKAAPRLEEEHGAGVLGALRAAPAILAAALVFGVLDSGLFGLFPVYAVRSGFSEAQAALAIATTSLGSMVFQYPLGMLADRFDRRMLLIVCALAGMAGAALTPFAIHAPPLMYALLFFWGGIIMGIYTIGLTLVGERFKGAELASANAAYVMLYAGGLFAGPMAGGFALDAWNPHGLMAELCLVAALYVAFLALRRREPGGVTR